MGVLVQVTIKVLYLLVLFFLINRQVIRRASSQQVRKMLTNTPKNLLKTPPKTTPSNCLTPSATALCNFQAAHPAFRKLRSPLLDNVPPGPKPRVFTLCLVLPPLFFFFFFCFYPPIFKPLAAPLTDPGPGHGTGNVVPVAIGEDGGAVLALVACVIGFTAVPEPAGGGTSFWVENSFWEFVAFGFVCFFLSRGKSGRARTSPAASPGEGPPKKPFSPRLIQQRNFSDFSHFPPI